MEEPEGEGLVRRPRPSWGLKEKLSAGRVHHMWQEKHLLCYCGAYAGLPLHLIHKEGGRQDGDNKRHASQRDGSHAGEP